ncbi:MAG TPA: SpoVR family protein, partial [Blastocatellia bacterium]|nr:SpoVR family protein [Blastocatellia bacterium]
MDREVKELEKAMELIWEIATGKFGLDPFPTRFEIVPATVMYEIGSYALPGRYSHWSFGKAYHKMKTMYDFGLSKIYEVVINSNPSYAFLLENNSLLQNKLVIAHVLGHVDFFKHNVYFSQTNRRMVDDAATHARRINEYEFKYGRKVVEEFLDAVLSIEEHIDPNFFIKKSRDLKAADQERRPPVGRYDDLISEQEREALEKAEAAKLQERRLEAEKDLVWFIMQHSPILQPWQRDVMSMIHDEMLYFVPQMQTKIMNEGWACAVGDSLLVTEDGLLRFDELYEARAKIQVASGGAGHMGWISDFHREPQVPTIKIRTRRGFVIEGAEKHRVQMADGTWAYLTQVATGDRVTLARETAIWPSRKQPLNFAPAPPSAGLEQVAELAGVSYATAFRHLHQTVKSRRAESIGLAMATVAYQPGVKGRVLPTRTALNLPSELNEELAWFLGYFIGDGNLNKSGIGLTTGDQELAQKLARTIDSVFGLEAAVKLDESGGHRRWRVTIYSREIWGMLEAVGIDLDDKARNKKVPALIRRSPKSVTAAFIRGYFDADAYAGPEGIRLSSSSSELIRTIQIMLLNFGILSRQRQHPEEILQLEICGVSAARFAEEIGFGLERKQLALQQYVANHRWFKPEDLTDEIVSIESGRADVYDITVDEKHAYVANGLINHNSFWHSRIMREMNLPDHEHLEFAELHSGVVSPHRNQLNPYYLGYKIFEDIEKRWDNPTKEEQERRGRRPGEGRAKIFEIREVDNDVSFLRNYLTEDLCEELDLFVYELVDEEEWTVTEKRWERVRDQLVANMTNFGFPYIEVIDADYEGNRELYLRHRYEGVELDQKYARKVLEYVHKLWGRTVHLETKVEDETASWRYDGEEHTEG